MGGIAEVFQAVSAVSSLLGAVGSAKSATKSAPAPTPLPEPKPVPVMPEPDDAASQLARRKRVAEIQGRSGRESTFLSDVGQNDRLGAG